VCTCHSALSFFFEGPLILAIPRRYVIQEGNCPPQPLPSLEDGESPS
jgi:hypothetical protein